jgi:hypothetical protein
MGCTLRLKQLLMKRSQHRNGGALQGGHVMSKAYNDALWCYRAFSRRLEMSFSKCKQKVQL